LISPQLISGPTISSCERHPLNAKRPVCEQLLKNGASHQGAPDWRTAAARCSACELTGREKKPKVAVLPARLRRAVLQLWQEMNEDASRK
jgi:hypothetical protein